MRNDSQKKVTEKTDPKKINVPDFAKPKDDSTFVSKVKTKR